MNSKPELRVAWCSPKASRWACRRWHYSGTRPTSPHNDLGVWEDGLFIGCVLFGLGAAGTLGIPYGLQVRQWAELTRVALAPTHRTPVSRIVSIAVGIIRKKNPALRLLFSFADPAQGHHGGIYQAMGWIYTGQSAPDFHWVLVDGTEVHKRRYAAQGFNAGRAVPPGAKRVRTPGKYRYVLPLDAEMRRIVQQKALPYPKRERSRDSAAASDHEAEGGANPTRSLHLIQKAVR